MILNHSTFLTDNFKAKNAIILNPIDIPIKIPIHFQMPNSNPMVIKSLIN